MIWRGGPLPTSLWPRCSILLSAKWAEALFHAGYARSIFQTQEMMIQERIGQYVHVACYRSSPGIFQILSARSPNVFCNWPDFTKEIALGYGLK